MITTTFEQAQNQALAFDSQQYQGSAIRARNACDNTSQNYRYVDTKSVVDRFADSGLLPTRYEQARVLKERFEGFQRHQVILLSPTSQAVVSEGYRLGVSIQNSHKADSSIHLNGFIEVLKCLNGVHVGSQFAAFYIRHSGKKVYDQLDLAVTGLLSQFDGIRSQIAIMQGRVLDRGSQLDFAAAALKFWFPKGRQGLDPRDLIQPIREDGYSDFSLWRVFNDVQERLTRGFYRYQIANTSWRNARAIKAISSQTELNRGLWDIAAQYN